MLVAEQVQAIGLEHYGIEELAAHAVAQQPRAVLGERARTNKSVEGLASAVITTPTVLNVSSIKTVALDVWGAPISRPRPDPNNADFVYQRFQRGILHRITSQGATRGILLADYLKAILLDRDLPGDLREQALRSRFLAQYCPNSTDWLCRPGELDATNLSFAFEQG